MKNNRYQIIAGLQELTGEIIYSRAHHDYITTSDGTGFVDGGQAGHYIRHGGVKIIAIESDVDYGVLYDDWNNRTDKYGRTNISEAKIIPKEELLDRTSFEFKKQSLTWGTYGKNGDQPRRTICLVNADTDHLQAILSTQRHISEESIEIIQSILKDRNVHV